MTTCFKDHPTENVDIYQYFEGKMRKALFNAFWFIPVVIFGCFDGNFSGRNDEIYIEDQVRTKLDEKSLVILNKYGKTIHTYSQKYGVDWRLVIAVMKVESRFNPSARSHKGANGLMQIMPTTQSEIADKLGKEIDYFNNPHGNIKGGIFYLSRLYKQFDGMGLSEENQIKFTLAAYNAGYSRILDAQRMADYVNDDPKEWKSIKNSMPLLSKKYASLHRFVWVDRKPSSGYFKDWKQTANYVETVMTYYNEYRNAIS